MSMILAVHTALRPEEVVPDILVPARLMCEHAPRCSIEAWEDREDERIRGGFDRMRCEYSEIWRLIFVPLQ